MKVEQRNFAGCPFLLLVSFEEQPEMKRPEVALRPCAKNRGVRLLLQATAQEAEAQKASAHQPEGHRLGDGCYVDRKLIRPYSCVYVGEGTATRVGCRLGETREVGEG